MLTKGVPPVLGGCKTAILKFRDQGLRDFIEPAGEIGRLKNKAVAGVALIPILHLVGDGLEEPTMVNLPRLPANLKYTSRIVHVLS